MRQVVLDTETTGLEPAKGHRVIEIGCVELLERRRTGRKFHAYLNPERAIDQGALEVHGLNEEFLRDKPKFKDVAAQFLDFVDGAELVAHNAAFDLSFLDYEFSLMDLAPLSTRGPVLDTLALARERFPGQRNNLDALCRRLGVDASHRELHGALLDASLLADVYLAMTAGQGDLGFLMESDAVSVVRRERNLAAGRLRVLRATPVELEAHRARLAVIDKASKGQCVWSALEADAASRDLASVA